jgi:hypothetical protein
MRTALYYLGLGLILVLFLNSSGPNLDIRDVLKSYIIARYYGWEPKKEDLEEIISNTSYFNIHVDDAIYEVLTMPREEITI